MKLGYGEVIRGSREWDVDNQTWGQESPGKGIPQPHKIGKRPQSRGVPEGLVILLQAAAWGIHLPGV